MNALLKKLNFKDHEALLVLDAPDEFQAHLEAFAEDATVHTTAARGKKYDFALAFVTSAKGIDALAKKLPKAMADGDSVVWIAYPKKSSKKYKTDISRDSGWGPLGELGFEGVRQIAIDDDWSALRFRHVDHIKDMKRNTSRALSSKGKKRTAGDDE